MKKGIEVEAFNNSLIKNEDYVHQIRKLILDTLNELFNEHILDDQVKWEYSKYNIRKYIINFSKNLAKNANKKIADLETKLKDFENYVDNIEYKVCKQQLNPYTKKKQKV